MKDVFDLTKFDSYKEDNRREVKKAEGGLPNSLWDTHSAFANCYGGVIILGVKEDKNGGWHTTGLKNAAKLKKDFWDTINNRKKVSLNLLRDDDVETFSMDDTDDVIMVIWVPSAKREQKPVYINDDLFGGGNFPQKLGRGLSLYQITDQNDVKGSVRGNHGYGST